MRISGRRCPSPIVSEIQITVGDYREIEKGVKDPTTSRCMHPSVVGDGQLISSRDADGMDAGL